MTDREKAIVMAYTGICMFSGERLRIYYDYIEEICGRPLWSHEFAFKEIQDEIKEKSKEDFMRLCEEE